MATANQIEYKLGRNVGWGMATRGQQSRSELEACWEEPRRPGLSLADYGKALLGRYHDPGAVGYFDLLGPLLHYDDWTGAAVGAALAKSLRVQFETAAGLDEALVASAADLAAVLTQVNSLAFDVEEDEFGPVRPSYQASKHCMKLLLELAAEGRLPRPSDIGSDHDGAIRVSWSRNGREAELVCPSEGEEAPYIYYSSADSYGTDDRVTAENLFTRVHWALGGE